MNRLMITELAACFLCLVSLGHSARIVSDRKGPVSGDCWQGALCEQRCLTNNRTAGYVGSINDLYVCCPFCERSGLMMSSSHCDCRHNGPDPTYVPTEDELREVEEFKKRSAASPMQASIILSFGAVLSQFILSLQQ